MGGSGKHHEEQQAQQCRHEGQLLAHQRQDFSIIRGRGIHTTASPAVMENYLLWAYENFVTANLNP